MLYTDPITYELQDTSYSRLSKLQYWLKYELSSSVLFLLSFFGLFFAFILAIAAVIFAPYMLHVLYKEKRSGWIVFFFMVILSPAVLLLAGMNYLLIAGFLSMGAFYIYCFLLKFVSDEWLRERSAYLERMRYERLRDSIQHQMN